MKKLIAICIAVLLVLGISVMSYAAYQETLDTESQLISLTKMTAVSVTVHVPEVHGFVLWADEYAQHLWPYRTSYRMKDAQGNVVYKKDAAGKPTTEPVMVDPAFGKLNIVVTTNKGLVWYIVASSTGVTASGGTVVIPLRLVTWIDDTDLKGIPTKGRGDDAPDGSVPLTASQKLIYTSEASERVCTGLTIPGLFWADLDSVTGAIPAASYTGSLTLTLLPQ